MFCVVSAQVLTARTTEVSKELAKMSVDEKLVPFTLNNDLMMVSCTCDTKVLVMPIAVCTCDNMHR